MGLSSMSFFLLNRGFVSSHQFTSVHVFISLSLHMTLASLGCALRPNSVPMTANGFKESEHPVSLFGGVTLDIIHLIQCPHPEPCPLCPAI